MTENERMSSKQIQLSDEMSKSANSEPRYAICEQHGSGPSAVRIVGDQKASGVTASSAPHDATAPDKSDGLLEVPPTTD